MAHRHQRQAHHNRVPQLPVGSPVLPGAAPFLDEAAFAVQRDRGRIVREYLQAELVQPMAMRPVDRRGQQGRADPVPAAAAVHQHRKLAEAVVADLQAEHPDDLAIGHRHDGRICAACEARGTLVDVDRWLGRDPIAFLSHGGEEFCHRPRIASLRRSDLELHHWRMPAPLPPAEWILVLSRWRATERRHRVPVSFGHLRSPER